MATMRSWAWADSFNLKDSDGLSVFMAVALIKNNNVHVLILPCGIYMIVGLLSLRVIMGNLKCT
jgi:hypothetical protein